MKKIYSLVAAMTALAMSSPLVMTVFAETVSSEPAAAAAAAEQGTADAAAVTTTAVTAAEITGTTTTVTAAPLWPDIQFDSGGASGHAGDDFTFTLLGYDDGREYGPGESPVTFTVSDESVVRIISVSGMTVGFEMLAPGHAVIRGTLPDGRYAEFDCDVYEEIIPDPLPSSEIEFSEEVVYLDPGETAEVELLGFGGPLRYDYDGDHDVNIIAYADDNGDEIVRITGTEGNKLTLEGVASGFTHIYASFKNGWNAGMRVFVRPLPELRMDEESVSIYPDDYYQVSLKGHCEYLDSIDPAHPLAKYEFDDPSLVEIISASDSCIDFRGIASGSTTLHASVPDGRTAEIPVTILPDRFRFADADPDHPVIERLPGEHGSLEVKGGDAVFSVADDGIIEVLASEDKNVLEFKGVTPGETTVTAVCGDETLTARIIILDPAMTTTTSVAVTEALGMGTTTYTTSVTEADSSGTTQENGSAGTTAEAGAATAAPQTTAEMSIVTEAVYMTETTASAPAGDLPQTGNNDMTPLLVIIGTFVLTGTGVLLLKFSGTPDSGEQSD